MDDKWYKDQKDNLLEERSCIITAAAKLIKHEVCCTNFNTDYYPLLEDIRMTADFLPPSLRLLIELLLNFREPNSVISSLISGLSTEIDHANGSELAQLGYSILYNEGKQYKQLLMVNMSNFNESPVAELIQLVPDNIEHNVCTLDEKETFNGMGIVFFSGYVSIVGTRVCWPKKL